MMRRGRPRAFDMNQQRGPALASGTLVGRCALENLNPSANEWVAKSVRTLSTREG